MIDLFVFLKGIGIFFTDHDQGHQFYFIAPFFGMNNTPKRVKLHWVFLYLIYCIRSLRLICMLHIIQHLVMQSILWKKQQWTFDRIRGNMCMMIMTFAGRMIDTDIGLSMASQYDRMTQDTTTITGQLYQHALLLMLVISGMYQFILKALVETFTLIPIGAAIFRYDRIVTALIEFRVIMSSSVSVFFFLFSCIDVIIKCNSWNTGKSHHSLICSQ